MNERKEIDPNNRGSIVIGSVAFYLDRAGYDVLPLALRMLQGQTLAAAHGGRPPAGHRGQRVRRVPALRHELSAPARDRISGRRRREVDPLDTLARRGRALSRRSGSHVGLTVTTGYSVNVASVPPPGSGRRWPRPSRGRRCRPGMRRPGSVPASTDATNPTVPAASTAGQGPKCENVPPPGAPSPVAATLRTRPSSTANTAAVDGPVLAAPRGRRRGPRR